MTRDPDYLTGKNPATDNEGLEALAQILRTRSPVPALLCVKDITLSPLAFLESLVATGQGVSSNNLVKLMGLDHHASVKTIARLLLDRLRSTGQLPDTAARPVPISTRDDVEALGQLARAYRAERPVPTTIRVGGAPISVELFLSGFVHDRRECPSSIASDVGIANHPASMREVAASLHGRLRQAGAL